MSAEVTTNSKALKSPQNDSAVESTDSEERSDASLEVKAQVMKRSDAGWVPIDGGGLSVVGLTSLQNDSKADAVQYRVNARRVKDNASLLSCILKKDLAYTKGNSLFHHWQTQGQKFGLTFHSSADATTFEQWICNAKRNLVGSQMIGNDTDQNDDEVTRESRLIKDTVSLPGSRARTPSPGANNRVNMRHSSILLSSYPSSYPALHNIRLNRNEENINRCNAILASRAVWNSILNSVDDDDADDDDNDDGVVNDGDEEIKAEKTHCHRNVKQDRKRMHHRKSEDRTNIWIKRDDLSMPEFSAMNCSTTDSSYVQFSKSDLAASSSRPDSKTTGHTVHEYFYPTLDSSGEPSHHLHHPYQPNQSSRRHLSPTSSFSPSSYMGIDSYGVSTLRLPEKIHPCNKKNKKKKRKNNMINNYNNTNTNNNIINAKKNNSSTNSSSSKQNIERECFSVTSLSSKHSSSGNLQQLHMAQSRRRCLKCREFYYETENCAGRCAYGSDRCVKCIEAVSCVACTRAVLYHFAADENGDYGEVCSCTDGHHRNSRKWVVSAILSIFMPCLCCYLPLSACHKSCVRCGRCGARHKCD